MEEESKNNEKNVKVAVEKKEDEEKIAVKNEKNKEKETVVKKKNKKAKIAMITIIVILILVVLGVGGFFAYKYVQENQTVGTAWGDTYYAYLKEAAEAENPSEKQLYGIKPDMQNAKIEFCEVKENEVPVMVMTYEKDEKQYLTTYYINKKGEVKYTAHDMPSTLELLYNIELEQYIWYINTESKSTNTYKPLINSTDITVQESTTNEGKTETTEYIISKDEETTQETVDGENITLSKFDETFVRPEVEESAKIDFNIDLIVKEIKQAIEEAIKGFKIESEIVTDDVEKQVEEKVEEIENTKQQIETAKQEIEQKKAEEEAKKKVEEEARKAAEETAKEQEEANQNTTTASTTTASDRITEEQARKLAEQVDGTYAEEVGYEIGYTLERMVKDSTGQEYYLFRVRWLVEDHWSTIDGVAISVDGKKWKQTDIYSKGETMGEVYREGTF